VKARGSVLALRAADVVLSGTAASVGAGVLLARKLRRAATVPTLHPRLLVINATYSLSVLRARQSEHFATHRDLAGYFDRVWSVHPLVGAHPGEPPGAGVGAPTVTPLNDVHTMIEGKTRRFDGLARLPYLNFTLAQLELVLLLDRIVDRQGVGIVRGDPYYSGLLALLLGRSNRRPVELRIIADHDAIYDSVGALAHPRLFHRRAVEQRVTRYTLSHADSVVAGSADIRSFALRNGARSDRLAYAGNWSMINPIHLSEPRERQPLEDEFGLCARPIVVCVSRLERMKHPEDVIISVAKAQARHPHLAAVIVGDGAMRRELEELCEELGVQDDVVFAGDRDQRWIARLLAQSTVIAAPLAGLALVESALSGTPIVAYDVDWHSELIRNGQEGILVPYRDCEALAAAICALVEDQEEASRLADAARGAALETMQPEKLLADERSLADALLARRLGGPEPGRLGQPSGHRVALRSQGDGVGPAGTRC